MEYRKLGKTGLDVSMIGLGTEYLNGVPRDMVVSVIGKAVDSGVNYIDLFFAHAEIRDNIGVALKGRRDSVILAGHLGAIEENSQHAKTRDRKECEKFFLDFLTRLRTDHADVLMLHHVDSEEEYAEVLDKSLELAHRFQQEGKARLIGISGHNPQVALTAMRSGIVDVLMYPVNLAGDAMPGRKELLNACVSEGVGLVAMKPFAGGKLLQKTRSISLEQYQSGWKKLQKDISTPITPVQCLSYTASQIGVSTIVPGVKDVDELEATLHLLDATDDEKDFSGIIAGFQEYIEGECVYCNHCLPCPAVIDIGRTIRLLETGEHELSDDLRMDYDSLSSKASDCIECGLCVERCPFGVDAILKMRQAVELFEAAN